MTRKPASSSRSRPIPSIAAYYAGLATGEIDTLIGGPTYFQKLRLENVPIKIIATGAKLSDLVIIAKDPAIKSLADLKGKQLAVDMGSGQFQVLSIYAKSKGIDLAKDMQLVSANFAVARAQLAAERVDAAMIIEPIATMMIKENPALKIVFQANDAWKEMTGKEGWELVYAMREDTLKRTPDAAKMFIAALADVAAFMRSNTDEADKIATDTVKLPPGILKAAVESEALGFRGAAGLGRRARQPVEHVRARGRGRLPPETPGRRHHLCPLRSRVRRRSSGKLPREAIFSILGFAVLWECLAQAAPYLGIPAFAVPSFTKIWASLRTSPPSTSR